MDLLNSKIQFRIRIVLFALVFVLPIQISLGKNAQKNYPEKLAIISFTQDEISWIRSHPVIRLGIDHQFAPFEFIDKNGQYNGMAADYIKLLNERLGIQMEIVLDLSWNEVIEKAKKKEIDVLPCVGMTEERKKYFLYSESYIAFPRVIITRIDAPFVGGIEDIYDKKVAIQQNSSHHGYLSANTPIKPILYQTAEKALIAVSKGSVDANIGNMAAVAYLIQKNNLSNLKIAAPVSTEINSLYFVVRKDWSPLVSIINKGLASISVEEESAIRKKWTTVRFEHGIDVGFIIKVAVQVGMGVLLIIATILIWNRKLKKEVIERKKAERNEREAKEKAEQTAKELAETLQELESTQDQLVQSEKLAALGQLISGIAHEINTPLGAIQSSLDSVAGVLEGIFQSLPKIAAELSTEDLELFFKMTNNSRHQVEKPSAAERRKLIKNVTAKLRECDKFSADTLILCGHAEQPELFLPLINHPQREIIFKTARQLYYLKNGIGTISISTQKTAKVVTALKTFANTEESGEKQYVDLQTNIENIITLYENQMRQGITLKTHFDKLNPVPCFIDKLNQVWTNLIHNALQAMDNQGILDISLTEEDGSAQFIIKDSGKGIPEDIQHKIFEPFFTTKKTGEGSGLGLDTVRKIIEQHNGMIRFESQTDQGTAFFVSIPLI